MTINYTTNLIVDGLTDYSADNIRKTFRRGLMFGDRYDPVTLDRTVELLFSSVLKKLFFEPGKNGPFPKAEETALALIRLGVPKENVRAGYNHVTVSLPNATYRIYRETSGRHAGTLRVTRNDCQSLVRCGLESEDLARFLMDVDPLLPAIEERGRDLFRELEKEQLQAETEWKAQEIERISVEHQLGAVLPAMDIGCQYRITDGVVHLDLTRLFQAGLDIPVQDLPAFLADPAGILAALSPAPAEISGKTAGTPLH